MIIISDIMMDASK